MKNILILLLVIVPLSAKAVDKTVCENAKGSVIVINGHSYCRSGQRLNWWNARSWCDALGSDLIDLSTICNDYYQTKDCPPFVDKGQDRIWVKNVYDSASAYTVSLSTGGVTNIKRSWGYGANYGILITALCQ